MDLRVAESELMDLIYLAQETFANFVRAFFFVHPVGTEAFSCKWIEKEGLQTPALNHALSGE
jgi:hypothetical protein